MPRQELAIKLVFAMRAGPEQVRDVVQHQLVATTTSLQEFTKLKATAERDGDLAWLMMLDALIFQAEAEARWLELCEARLARTRSQPRSGAEAGRRGPRCGADAVMSVLSMERVGRRYGSPPRQVVALDDVSLTVQAGEMLAVMGPSGSGKSTLMQLAGGLTRPTSGRVVLSGSDLGTLGEADLSLVLRRRVGFVFQNATLLAALTAAENVSLPLELDGMRPRPAMAAARALRRLARPRRRR